MPRTLIQRREQMHSNASSGFADAGVAADQAKTAASSASAASGALRNAMTVDVEEYFQVGAFERCVAREDWGRYASRN